MQQLIIAILTFGLLVAFHEWGHFWVARRCGVKVLRFAIGFGPVLLRWRDRHDTEYALCALPLGGYVKMLDSRETSVAPELMAQEFNTKHPAKRIAIAGAGPVANFILALLAFWCVFLIGERGVVPIVGNIVPQSPAAMAGLQTGDELTAIDGAAVSRWQDAMQALLPRMGHTGQVQLEIKRDGVTQTKQAPINAWLSGAVEPDVLASFGIEPYRVPIPAKIGSIVEASAAQTAGMLIDDEIVSLDGELIQDWYHMVELIQQHPEQSVTVTVKRQQQTQVLTLKPHVKTNAAGQRVGFAGIAPIAVTYPEQYIRHFDYSVLAALTKAWQQLAYYCQFTFVSFGKLLIGDISVKNLSGPISIAKVASQSAAYGLGSYLKLLAILSISLGVLNLLPVPVLDGGHIVFHSIEWIKGSPVSEVTQEWALRIGLALVLCLMAFALVNDISRLQFVKSLF